MWKHFVSDHLGIRILVDKCQVIRVLLCRYLFISVTLKLSMFTCAGIAHECLMRASKRAGEYLYGGR